VTLLFAQEVYEKVAEAHIAGLEDLAKRGGNLKKIGGVASFFISRIDSLVDSMIEEKLKSDDRCATAGTVKEFAGQSCHRQWQAHLSEISAHFQRTAMAGSGGTRERRLSAFCGPARARRIPLIATLCTLRN
jgi:transaldolase / glucose-6-phosphate isomerase